MFEQEGSPALLLADMSILPGMDGGPVIDGNGLFIGMLGTPLCSHNFKAEVRQRTRPCTLWNRQHECALNALYFLALTSCCLLRDWLFRCQQLYQPNVSSEV